MLNAGEVPLQTPVERAFSIFYRGCKQSNLSTQPLGLLSVLLRCCKGTYFPSHLLHMSPVFFCLAIFFNYSKLFELFQERFYALAGGGVYGVVGNLCERVQHELPFVHQGVGDTQPWGFDSLVAV